MHVSPMPIPRAHNQEAISAGEAPAACAASKIMAAELVYPTNTAINPAETCAGENQLAMRLPTLCSSVLIFIVRNSAQRKISR